MEYRLSAFKISKKADSKIKPGAEMDQMFLFQLKEQLSGNKISNDELLRFTQIYFCIFCLSVRQYFIFQMFNSPWKILFFLIIIQVMNFIKQMKQTYAELILIGLLVLQVLILIFSDHNYFGAYIDFTVLCLVLTACYLAFRYFQISRKMPIRLSSLEPKQNYQFMTEKLRGSQIDKLLQTEQMKQLEKMKKSRQFRLSKKDQDDDDFIKQLEQKEQQIFSLNQ